MSYDATTLMDLHKMLSTMLATYVVFDFFYPRAKGMRLLS